MILSKKHHTTNRQLIDRMVSTIVWLYNYELVSYDKVKEYLGDIMLDDKHEGLSMVLYYEYLKKITETALLLAEKIEVPKTVDKMIW